MKKTELTKIVNAMIKWAEKKLETKNNGECGIQFGKFADGRDNATFFFDGSFYDCFSWNSSIPKLYDEFEEKFQEKLGKIGYEMEAECSGRITIYKAF